MLQAEELKQKIQGFKSPILDLKEAIGYEKLKEKIRSLEAQSFGGTFWNDSAESSKILREIKRAKDKLGAFDALWEKYEDALTLLEITAEEEGEDALEEVHQYAVELNHSIENMRLSTLLRGEYDG
ncbi:MAG: peptide chain release factor 2, partial [Oscillospiraceae bacterium]